MGFHPDCSVQNCIDNCCNSHGTCPSDYTSGGESWTNCAHSYINVISSGSDDYDYESTMALSYGLSFGIIGLFLFIALVCWIKKRQQEQANMVAQNNTGTGDETVIIYNPNNQIYGQQGYNVQNQASFNNYP